MSVDRVVVEVGSALNGHRKKFLALLRDPSVSRIVVEHRDRFARSATEYIEASLPAQGRGSWWSLTRPSSATTLCGT